MPIAFTNLLLYSVLRETLMTMTEPNQASRRNINVSTALVVGLILIIGVGVITGPA